MAMNPEPGEPNVSVVITNYNYARYLPIAIESALAQISPPREVIVVDDGSTDGSPDVIAHYAAEIVPVLKPNGGQTSAWNAGFARAGGEIICFLDADDVLEPTALKEACQRFEDPCVVKVHWPLWIIGTEGRKTGRRKPSHRLQEGELMPILLNSGPDYPGWVPTSGNAWRRTFLERVFPLPEVEREIGSGSASADAYLSMLTPLFGTVRRVETPQGCYRVHGTNDHSCMKFEKRLERDVALFEHRSATLLSYCEQFGVKVDPNVWRENSWFYKLKRALEELDTVIPSGVPFILVDDLTWQLRRTENRAFIPFLEKGGQYAGPPGNSCTAIAELERLRAAGAQFVVFAWPSFWWLQSFPEFRDYLQAQFLCVHQSSETMIFKLSPLTSSRQEEDFRAVPAPNALVL
jgi:glycosyltransferase involved in cell wall biosynthesis